MLFSFIFPSIRLYYSVIFPQKMRLQKYNFNEFIPLFPVSNVDNFSVTFLQIRRISHNKIQYYRHFRKEDAHLAFPHIVDNFFAGTALFQPAIALFNPFSTLFPPFFHPIPPATRPLPSFQPYWVAQSTLNFEL